jgi:hypothetical protein
MAIVHWSLLLTNTVKPTERFTDLGKLNFAYGGSILVSSQFIQVPQLPLKMMLGLNVVKIINSLH